MNARFRPLGIGAVVAALIVLSQTGASAAPVFLERYGNLFAARPFLTPARDTRPRDALQGQATRTDEPNRRLVLSPFIRDDDRSSFFGGGAAYASVQNPAHPWSVEFTYSRLGIDGGESFDTLTAAGRVVLWQPVDPRLPVISLVGSYFDPDDLGRRWDLLLAADQRLTRDLFFTANLGYGRSNYRLSGWESDLVPGFGLTYSCCPRLSVAADYLIDNDVDGEDAWSLSAIYAFDSTSSLRVGGGKHGLVFANYLAKWDWK